MSVIKRYDVRTKIICRGECGVVEDAGGPYLLASDIDADALQSGIDAINFVVSTELVGWNSDHHELLELENAIANLSALLAAVRKV